MTHRSILLAATALLAAGAYAQPAPTPPPAPPIPQPGSAEPMTQAKPPAIAESPTGGKKEQKWDVNARHGPGHDVPINVTEGTWMNLDVSPDGQEIAFDLLGDIYVMPIGGGEARPLATSELAERLGASAGGVSDHLRVLREAGLVSARREGRRVVYARTATGEALCGSDVPRGR